MTPITSLDPPPGPPPAPAPWPPADAALAPPAPARRRRGTLAAIVVLAIALAAALGGVAFLGLQLAAAQGRLDRQERELERLTELIEQKETFGAAMEELLEASRAQEGLLLASVVPLAEYQRLADAAWADRWDPDALDRDIARARAALAELRARVDAAALESAANASGSTYEEVTDRLGRGFVASELGDADAFCGGEVLGCVHPLDPYTIHYDALETTEPYMTDWLRTGLAYHEFAHVLQFTNPEPTATALQAFAGDYEAMADCFALTYLDGWTLDHRVWVSATEYWDVSIGYGHACTPEQAQAVRDWYARLGVRVTPISQ